jgi:hypothetical protein
MCERVGEIVRRVTQGRYELNPDFQRAFVWSPEKQSRLIESCTMSIPLPVFYVAENEDGKIIVVDGLQRLTTFDRFLNNQFKLTLQNGLAEYQGGLSFWAFLGGSPTTARQAGRHAGDDRGAATMRTELHQRAVSSSLSDWVTIKERTGGQASPVRSRGLPSGTRSRHRLPCPPSSLFFREPSGEPSKSLHRGLSPSA